MSTCGGRQPVSESSGMFVKLPGAQDSKSLNVEPKNLDEYYAY